MRSNRDHGTGSDGRKVVYRMTLGTYRLSATVTALIFPTRYVALDFRGFGGWPPHDAGRVTWG
jgi:hypothetical protein